MANEVYFKSWWGIAYRDGFGAIYFDYIFVTDYINRVELDGGIVENPNCIINKI